MIQRIQTLYLIIVVLLMGATFLLPSAGGVVSTANYNNFYEIMPFGVWGSAMDSVGQESLFSTTLLGVIIVATIALSVYIISQFRNLMMQIRFTVFLIVLLLGAGALMIYYGYKLTSQLDAMSDVQNGFPLMIGAAMPFVSALLSYLAMRAMIKDMLLLNSLNSKRMR